MANIVKPHKEKSINQETYPLQKLNAWFQMSAYIMGWG